MKSDFSLAQVDAYGYQDGNEALCAAEQRGGPNAVKRVGTPQGQRSYCYDASGNLIRDSFGFLARYDAMNLPLRVERGGRVQAFRYGADNQRTRQLDALGRTTRIYLDGVEHDLTEGRYRVYWGDHSLITRQGLSRQHHHLLRDRQGGVDGMLAAGGGEAPVFRGYDAFGGPRHGDWSDHDRLEAGDITPRGFTDHEHLDAVELIHMNGRAYDYRLGRFLSVDPFIQAPLNSQSLNPYSYIMNNPLAGTDPTGYISIPSGDSCLTGPFQLYCDRAGPPGSPAREIGGGGESGNGAKHRKSRSSGDNGAVTATGARKKDKSTSGADGIGANPGLFSGDPLAGIFGVIPSKWTPRRIALGPKTELDDLTTDQLAIIPYLERAIEVLEDGLNNTNSIHPTVVALQNRFTNNTIQFQYTHLTNPDDFAIATAPLIYDRGIGEYRADLGADAVVQFLGITASNFMSTPPQRALRGYHAPQRRGLAGILDLVVHEAGHTVAFPRGFGRSSLGDIQQRHFKRFRVPYESAADDVLILLRKEGIVP
jgi:RHS repeat-associated protein